MVPDRRTFLLGAGAFVAATACSGGDDSGPAAPATSTTSSSPSASTAAPTTSAATDAASGSTSTTAPDGPPRLTPAMFASLAICQAVPEAPAGPFPTREQLDRRDITESYPGHPLRLGIRVLDASCDPRTDAEVEIWHADATGDYSSYEDGGDGKDEGEGTTFLRGVQSVDADGILEFQTIFPGWYPGRAVHIHARIRTRGDEHTTQLYFDETYTAAVYGEAPYAEFGLPDTGWDDDGLIGRPDRDGSAITLAAGPTVLGDGTLGLINLGLPLQDT